MEGIKFTYRQAEEAKYFDRLDLNRNRDLTAAQIKDAWKEAIKPMINEPSREEEYMLLNKARDDLLDQKVRNAYIDTLEKYDLSDGLMGNLIPFEGEESIDEVKQDSISMQQQLTSLRQYEFKADFNG